jgi:hypothetical protein
MTHAQEFKFRIHFDLPDGSEDSIVLYGDSIEQIREDAQAHVEKRGGMNPWSEPA